MTNAKIYRRTNYEENRKIKRRKNDLLYRRSLAYERNRFVLLPVTGNVSKQPGFCTSKQKGAMRGGSTFEIEVVQLRSVTEIAPKSPFFCVNRSCMQYDSLYGAKAIQYGVNIKNREKMPISCVALKKVSKRIFNKKIMKNKNAVSRVHVC